LFHIYKAYKEQNTNDLDFEGGINFWWCLCIEIALAIVASFILWHSIPFY
jgi:hypothetical protein